MASFKYGANFKITGKADPQKLSYAGAWQSTQGSFAELAGHIGQGHPWMPALLDGNGKRWQSNANYAEIIGADHDHGLSIIDALNHPFIAAHAGLLIESSSSTPEHNKFRTVYRLPRPVTDWQTLKVCNRYLIEKLGTADPACKDASRFFFGAPGKSPKLLNEVATLPQSFIEDALAWADALEAQQQLEAAEKAAKWAQWKAQNPSDSGDIVKDALGYIAPYSPGQGRYSNLIAMIGGVLAELGFEGESLLRDWDAGRGEWGRGGFDRILKSLTSSHSSRKASLGTLFYLAKQSGFSFPAPYSPSGPMVASSTAKPFDAQSWLEATKAEQAAYSRLDLAPTHEQTGEYIPQGWVKLPEQSGIIVLEAPMKSGKTSTALLNLVDQHRASNPQAQRLQIVPRNILGRQSGNKLGMPLHTDIPNFSIEDCLDVTACGESGPSKLDPSKMPKLEAIKQQSLEFGEFTVLGNRPLFIFDEPSQTIEQLLAGGTTKDRYYQVLKRLIELLEYVALNHGWVVLSEDGITNLEIEFIKAASKLEVIDYYKFNKVSKDSEEREYTIYTESPTMTWEKIESMLADDPKTSFWICSDSKRWLEETLEKLKKLGFSDSDMLLIDSDTSEKPAVKAFSANPDNHKYQFVLCSPTIQSGSSCEDYTGHYDAVAFHLVSMPAHTAKQLPERLRTNVPRFGFVSEFAATDSDDYSSSRAESIIKNKLFAVDDVFKLTQIAAWYQANEPYTDENSNKLDLIEVLGKLREEIKDINNPVGLITQFAAKYQARNHWGRQSIRADYVAYLESRGFKVKLEDGHSTKQKDIRAECREAIDLNKSVEFADIEIPSDMTLEDAHRALNSDGESRENILIARKFLLSDKFPGVDLNDAELINHCFIKDKGDFSRASELLWKAQNPDKAIYLDRWAYKSAFETAARRGEGINLLGMSNHSMKAKLLSEAPLEPFLSGHVDKWDGLTLEAIKVHEWAYSHRWELKRHLGMNIPEQVTTEPKKKDDPKPNAHKIVNRFLKKLGFEIDSIQPGSGGNRKRYYRLAAEANPYRSNLLNALTQRFDERLTAKTKGAKPESPQATHTICIDGANTEQQKVCAVPDSTQPSPDSIDQGTLDSQQPQLYRVNLDAFKGVPFMIEAHRPDGRLDVKSVLHPIAHLRAWPEQLTPWVPLPSDNDPPRLVPAMPASNQQPLGPEYVEF